MHLITLFNIIFFQLSAQNTTNAAKNTPIPQSQNLQTFDNLINVVGHCSFISIRSYQSSICEVRNVESFCNKITQIVQKKYGSPLVSFLANSTSSLMNSGLNALRPVKWANIKCSVWIQYDIIVVPPVFRSFEPNIFVLYSHLNNMTYHFHKTKWKNKASWLRALEPSFPKPMVMIIANPKSNEIRILCIYCNKLKIITSLVTITHFTQPFNPIAANFNNKLNFKNLQGTSIMFDRVHGVTSEKSGKLVKNSCHQYPIRFSTEDSICGMFLPSRRLNFTISKYQEFY